MSAPRLFPPRKAPRRRAAFAKAHCPAAIPGHPPPADAPGSPHASAQRPAASLCSSPFAQNRRTWTVASALRRGLLRSLRLSTAALVGITARALPLKFTIHHIYHLTNTHLTCRRSQCSSVSPSASRWLSIGFLPAGFPASKPHGKQCAKKERHDLRRVFLRGGD